MFESIKNHPFAVEAFFESSIVLTFAVPKQELEKLLPECLELDVFDDKWAFFAMAMVQTKGLRPKGFPKFLGNNFFLIGYRVFVKFTNSQGKRLRGLFILKSETDKKKMKFVGNLFTHYNYTTTDIIKETDGNILRFESLQSNFDIKIKVKSNCADLTKDSPFTDWKQARKYTGPLPFTFTYNELTKEVLIIEGVRQNWKPKPIEVIDYKISFMDSLKINNHVLANAFVIENIPYYWKKGKKERWEK